MPLWGHSSGCCPGSAALLLGLLALCLCGSACQRAAHKAIKPLRESAAEWDLRRGRDRLTQDDRSGAAAAFRQAVAYDSSNGAAHAELGRLLAIERNYATAAEHYREAVKSEPSNLPYALALGDVLERQAEHSPDRQELLHAAARTYAHARWLDQTSVEALIGMGRCLRLLGEFDAAAEILRTAAGRAPLDARTQLELAAVYHTVGNLPAALATYDGILEHDPENLPALNAAGILNLRLSLSGEAAHPAAAGEMPLASDSSSDAIGARRRAEALFLKSLEVDSRQPRIRALLESLKPAVSPLADGGDGTDSP